MKGEADQPSIAVAPPERIVVDELVVRRYVRGDARTLVDAVTRSIDHLRPWMPWIRFEPQTAAQRADLIDEWSAQWDARTEFVMGVFDGDNVVGGTGFHVREVSGSLEIGYWVAVNHTGRSIATRVSGALTGVALDLPVINEVRIAHDVANVASGRVPEKLGYVVVDEHDRQPEAPGEVGRVRHWAMTRERWDVLARTRAR